MKHYEVLTHQLANGETLAYRLAGSKGPHLVLVHGNMSSSVFFETTMNELEDYYQIIAVDLRGFGDSSYNQPISSLKEFGEDALELLQTLEVSEAAVLGWSTGGGVALEMAASNPDLVKKVILLDSVGIKGYPMFQKDENGQPLLDQPHTSKETIAEDAVQVAPVVYALANKDKTIMKAIWNALIYNLQQPNEDEYDLYLEAMFKQRNLVDVDYALMVFNMTNEHSGFSQGSNRIELIKAEVIIVHGEKDLVVPVAYAHEMKSYFQEQATLVIYEHTGHSLITDDFELFTKTIKEYV